MIKTLFATAALALASQAHAVVVAQWNFDTATAPGTSATWGAILPSTGSGVASGLHASANTVYSTPAGNGSAQSISANTWSVGDYWQFAFSTTGYTGLTVSFDQTGSNTGPRDFTLAYSANGGAFSNVASYTLVNAGWSSTTPMANSSYAFDLSAISALNNQSTVQLRLVDASTTAINGSTVATAGTGRVDNFAVNLTPVPEPGTSALLVAGIAAIGFIARRRG